MDVGYYAPAARTTLNHRVLVCLSQSQLAQSPSSSPSPPSLGIGGCAPPPGCGYPRNPATFRRRPWGRQALAGSSASGFVFILCNDKREDEGRQGVTHAPCRDDGSPTPTTRWRTTAASVVRRHGNTTESARRRTAKAPLGADTPASTQSFLSSNGHASSTAVWRRLKALSQHGVWSRRPSRRKSTVSSSSPAPPGALGAAADKTPPPGAGAPGASTKDKPANDRTSSRVAPVLLLRKGV